MEPPQLNWIANFLWGIADNVLCDLYVRGNYRDVILPVTVLRRLDVVLEPTKRACWHEGVARQGRDRPPRPGAAAGGGTAFYNTSKFTLRDLKKSRQPAQAERNRGQRRRLPGSIKATSATSKSNNLSNRGGFISRPTATRCFGS